MESKYALSSSERPVSDAVKSAQTVATIPPHGSVNGTVQQVHEGQAEQVEDNGSKRDNHTIFLRVVMVLGLITWLIALVSQAVVASTLTNSPVRILWFGIIMQTAVLVVLAMIILEDATLLYGGQIAHLCVIVTVFAVLGVDQNIYSTEPAQQATGAGWLLIAMLDLTLLLYFTSHPSHHFMFRIPLPSRGPSSHRPVERIGRSVDAFQGTTPAANGYDTEAAYPMTQGGAGGWRGSASNKSSHNRLSKNRPLSQARTSRITASEAGNDNTDLLPPPHPGAVPPGKAVSEATSPDSDAKWRAEALFDYTGNHEDPNELSFKKGDVLLVFNRTGKWWDSKLPNNPKIGIAPSNFLRILE